VAGGTVDAPPALQKKELERTPPRTGKLPKGIGDRNSRRMIIYEETTRIGPDPGLSPGYAGA